MTTPRLGAPELVSGQATPETTVNEQIRYIESGAGHFIFKDRDLATPPGSPADGDCYLVAASGTGAWSGKDGQIAFRVNTAWAFITALEGFTAWVNDENAFIGYDGAAWNVLATPSGTYIPTTYLDTDGTLAANSDVKLATQKATKTYVDAKVAGLSWKQAVRAATTAAVTLATDLENGDAIDGVTLATGDRILVKNQAAGAENGIYTVNASGAPTRATDADSGVELVNATVYVSEGTTNADTQWTCTNNATPTLGTTALAFAQLATGGGSLDGLSDVVITGGAQGDVLYHNGTNWVNLGAGTSGQYLKTQGTGANPVWASVSGAGNAWNLQWSPMVAEFPASNYATLDSRNNHPVLDFDTTTGETAYFTGVLPADYAGAGITVHLYVSMTSATSGTVGWLVAIERIDASSLDIDADSFAADNTLTAATVPATSGQVLKQSINISNGANMDSLAAGELFRLRITRDVANDTAAGDAELLRVMMVSQ
jgi:hypothetical protein